MRAISTRRLAGVAVMAAVTAAMTLPGAAAQAAPAAADSAASGSATAVHAYNLPAGVTDPCPASSPGTASCAALTSEPGSSGAAKSSATAITPAGYSPDQLRDAYGLQSLADGSGQTVAVVTPYGDPDAASDLAAYRSQYDLQPCTVADGCFSQVNETGGTSLPGISAGWNVSAAESIDMISAICPNCHILLVEATTDGITDLGTAENEAVTRGAKFVDNDWYIPEYQLSSAETTYDSDYFDHPGVAITAPAGDEGYASGVNYPAASPYVIAVGGTTLTAGGGTPSGYTEAAWPGSGSGCSAYEPKPSWQTDTGCTGRSLNDLAADADPSTAVAYYDTPTEGGWGKGGGTAVAAAIIAAAYALAGTPAAGTWPASYPYEHPGGSYTTPGNAYPYIDGLNNITSGSNGTCTVTYLCTAGNGYNGPTGLGSPSTSVSLTSSGAETGPVYAGIQTMCMADAGGVTTPGNPIQAYQCDGDAAQQWTFEPDGTVRFSSNDCLYVYNAGTSEGDDAELNTCSTTDGGDLWIPRANYSLYNPRSGMCLYDPNGTVNDTQLEIWDCGGSRTQQWPTPYSDPTATGTITSDLNSGVCADDHQSGTTDGTIIDVYTCNGTSAQQWTVEPNGALKVLGGCLTPDADGDTSGTGLVWEACDGAEDQHWILRSDGTIYGPASDLCVDDTSSITTNGTQIEIYQCEGTVQQSWNLP